jgi:peptidoglycan/LPS O-acetylase OafA/YrhL
MKRLQIIDLVRSLSILLVIGLHFSEMLRLPNNQLTDGLGAYFNNGRLGVSLFFTISGFLITEIITSGKYDHFHIDFKGFYIKRIGRIYPLVGLMVAAGFLIFLFYNPSRLAQQTVFRNPNYHYDFWFWASIPLFFFNLIVARGGTFGEYWRVLWSLAVEEQFYLAYPWILKAFKRSSRVMLFLGMIIGLGLIYRIAFSFFYFTYPWMGFLSSFGYYDQIAIGSALYFVSNQWKNSLSENKSQCAILSAIGFAIMLEAYFNMNINKPSYLNYAFIFGPFFISFGCFVFLLGGLHLNFFESKFWRWLTIPGQLSYASYLFHWAVLCFLYPVLLRLGPVTGLLLLVGVTVLLAYGSYVFFERPANNLIRHFFGQKKSLPLSIPGLKV